MCGICGIVTFNGQSQDGQTPVDEATLKRMNDQLRHRGPDDSGYYHDQCAALAMRRLSIIDLETGQQPISNEDNTVWLVFNGEIYNYRLLRRRLEQRGHRFTTQTDSEVIVHAYEEYGDNCMEHFNGMFAFAVWDSRRRRLLLARDRLGIKPLYYCADPDRFIFGSELKAVIAHPAVRRDLDLAALNKFLTLEYIPAPDTIFQAVKKLMPGHRLILEDGRIQSEPYWDVQFQQLPADEEQCSDMLLELIRDAVRIRMVSDVPLGAFLSGGIDSSTIVAFMSEASSEPIRTFSIGFGDPTYNELPYARLVARHFGTNHHEEFLTPDINELAVNLVGHLDEPLADFSIFPTYLVSKIARQQVTVALSGDGGDELFGGYESYVAQSYDRLYRHLPGWSRQRFLPAFMAMIPPRPAKKGAINKAKRFVEGGMLPAALAHTRWMIFMNEAERAALYHPELRAALNGNTPERLLEEYFEQVAGARPLAQLQYVDLKTYLAGNILTKVDRMSMAPSLEARVPLLDHRIVEFALSLPDKMKLHRGQTKRILRRAMAGRLPDEILNKPKEGFSIPLKHWLRGPLRPLLHDLLAPDAVRQRGYFNPRCINGWVSEHLDGRANHSHRLWALMVFELWQRQLLDATPHRVRNE